MTHGYRLGSHAAVQLAGEWVAVVSSDTRGWAVLSRADYSKLRDFFAEGTVVHEAASDTTDGAALERLYELGLVTRDGEYPPGAVPGTPAFPESLLLKMTGGCNLRCAYCYDYSSARAGRTLEPARAIATIDAIVGATGKLTITFHGGEPLLRFRDIQLIVAHGERLRTQGASIRYALQTNGSLLDDAIVAFLDEHRFSVGISLDGLWPETDAMRLRANPGLPSASASFERLLEKHGDFVRRRCGVLAVLYRASLRRLPEFILWLQSRGIGGFSTTVLDLSGRGRDLGQEDVTPDDLVELYRTWLELVRQGRIDDIAITNLIAYMDNLRVFDPPSFCQKGPCGAAGDFLVVDADGSFRACDCVIDDFFVIGDRCTPPNAALGHEPRRRILARHERVVGHGECAGCPWIRLCGGTCAAKALGRSEHPDQIYAPECAVNKFLYPALLREYAENPNGPIFRYHHRHSRLSRKAGDV